MGLSQTSPIPRSPDGDKKKNDLVIENTSNDLPFGLGMDELLSFSVMIQTGCLKTLKLLIILLTLGCSTDGR